MTGNTVHPTADSRKKARLRFRVCRSAVHGPSTLTAAAAANALTQVAQAWITYLITAGRSAGESLTSGTWATLSCFHAIPKAAANCSSKDGRPVVS